MGDGPTAFSTLFHTTLWRLFVLDASTLRVYPRRCVRRSVCPSRPCRNEFPTSVGPKRFRKEEFTVQNKFSMSAHLIGDTRNKKVRPSVHRSVRRASVGPSVGPSIGNAFSSACFPDRLSSAENAFVSRWSLFKSISLKMRVFY